MTKSGKNLEHLVRIVEEVYKNNPQTEIFSNYKIQNESGNKREIDLFIKSTVNNFNINIAIECKEYDNNISVEKIEAFNSKCLRIPEINKKIFVAKKGFQKDAIDAAGNFGIELYTFNDIKDNARQILLPISQIKPIFHGFEVLNVFCEENPKLSEISIKENNIEFYSLKQKRFSLYELIKEGINDKWYQISGMAFYQWMRDKTIEHKIHFLIDCQGIYFDYKDVQITVNQLECNAKINFEFIDISYNEMQYKNFKDDGIKANVLNFDFENNLKGKIVVDKTENLHFFDTTNENEIKKLDILFGYDPKTDKFTDYRKKIIMESVDITTQKGNYKVFNLPNVEKVEQFGGQIMVKFFDVIEEKPIKNPNKNCYLKLIGNLNEIDYQTVFDHIATFKFPEIETKSFLDSLLNSQNITIRKEIAENNELNYTFFENPFIAKIICS